MRDLRRVLVPGGAAVAVLVAVIAIIVDRTDIALALVAILAGLGVVLLWDLRRRTGDLAHMARLAARRQRELASNADASVAAASRAEAKIKQAEEKIKQAVIRTARETTQELTAVGQVLPGISPRRLLPALGSFAMTPREVGQLIDLLRERRPRTVLELGSGASTIWLGYIMEVTGGRVVSIDQDPGYGETTRTMATDHGLDSVVEVRVAEITDVAVDGETYRWYDPSVFADVSDIDLLLVDGPTKSTGPYARYPALPILLAQLAPTAVVVLDDANRPDEAQIVERWLASHSVQLESAPGDRLAVMHRVPNG